MGAFSGMKDAKRGYNSNPLKEGDYVARIDRCDFFESQQNGEFYKITLTLLAGQGAHNEGEVVNVLFGRKHGNTQFLQNVKTFIAGVMDVDDSAIGEAETVRTLAEFEGKAGENILAGLVTRVKASRRASKKKQEDGTPFEYSVYSWSPTLTDEDIKTALGPERLARFFPKGL